MMPVRRDPRYGRGSYRLPDADPDCNMDTYELKQRLLELFRSPTYQPPLLPAVALELLQLTRAPGVRMDQIVTLLGHDPLLAGQVLKVARRAALWLPRCTWPTVIRTSSAAVS